MQPVSAGTPRPLRLAAALTFAVVVLMVVEAMICVFLLQTATAGGRMGPERADRLKLLFGGLIGVNLLFAAGLGGGAVLTLARRAAGRVLIWLFGVVSAFQRVGCCGIGLLFLTANAIEPLHPGEHPFPIWIWWALVALESLTLVALISALVALATKAARSAAP